MGDAILFGVLRMPPELWRDDPLDVSQRHALYVRAADEIDWLRDALQKIVSREDHSQNQYFFDVIDIAKAALEGKVMGLKYIDADIDAVVIQKQRKRIEELESAHNAALELYCNAKEGIGDFELRIAELETERDNLILSMGVNERESQRLRAENKLLSSPAMLRLKDKRIAELETALKQSCEDNRSTMYPCPLQVDNERLRGEKQELIDILHRHGFRRCDIPVCNCGSWHHIEGFAARFREIEEATNDYYRNGETLLDRIKRILAALEGGKRCKDIIS